MNDHNDDTLVPMRNRARLLIAAVLGGGSLLSCNGGSPITPPATYGTVSGSVTSSLGGGIASVSVVLTPAGGSAMTAVTTNSSGAFTIPNVPVGTAGTGTISVSGVPQNCQPPATKSYTGLSTGGKVSADVPVSCVAPADTLSVQVTSSLGGAVANVTVVVTPTGGSALNGATTNSGGTASFTGIGLNGGSITLSTVPSSCVTPAAVTYSGKANGGTVAVPITLQCSATAGAITGTILSSQGNISIGAGVGVIVTPHGSNALPAVSTNANGVFAITGVAVSDGTGAITFTNLPPNCPTPTTATSYSGLTSGKSLTVNVTITCNPPAGVITGTITSSLGGGVAGIGVVVTPTGGTALAGVTTNSTGVFTVNGVPVGSGTGAGTGTVALNHLTANCSAPTSASNYTGLTNGGTVTVNITVTCTTPYGVIHGTIVTSWGEPIEGVVATATPTGGQPVAAQPSDSTGAFVVTVPVGPGTGQVTFGGTPVDCATIPTQNYTGLTNVRQVSLYVVPTCTLTGAMLVNISGETNLVSTSTANITLVGPLPPGHTPVTSAITQPGFINPLDTGSYSFKAASYQTSDPTVPQIFYPDSITQAHVSLQIDSTGTYIAVGDVDTIGVTYAWRAGTGEMWVADSSTMLMAGFTGPELRQGGSVSASTLIAQYNPVAPNAIAVDPDGRLWTSMGSTNQIIKWRDSAEYGGTSPSYVLLDVTASVSNPQGIAFDQNKILWAANAGNNTIIGINESGTVTKTVTSTALSQPTGMAFDANGNLWVANVGNNTIVEFTASQLASAGAETPGVVLSASGASISTPTALAFDPSGGLWVTNSAANTVVQFLSSSIGSSGIPAPAVTISANSGSLQTPRGLAFDFLGNLWVANEAANTVVEFSPAQIASGGSVVPAGSINSPGGIIGAPAGLAFNPTPPTVPINGSRVVKMVKPGVRVMARNQRVRIVRKKK